MIAELATVPMTPLHGWIAGRVGVAPERLRREDITLQQLHALRQTLRRVQQRSTFYAEYLRGVDAGGIRTLHHLAQIPFTTSRQLAQYSAGMLCVSQDEVNRVVTLASSGTSGPPKRLFFSTADQQSSLEFFEHGVATLTEPGDRMLIALPGDREGSVGQLLAEGIERAGVRAIPFGLISEPELALETMQRERATSIIGFPVQLAQLAALRGALADEVFARLTSIVLCSDYVSPALIDRLRSRAGCEVFQHYGMTETGLGGGVDCRAHRGYHLRECDLLFEIVDPQTGTPLPDGEVGELVFSTLTREAMPLIRYRTGDLASFAAQPCECGTCLRTLRYLRGRVGGGVALGGGTLTIADIEDALYELPEVCDIHCELARGKVDELMVLVACSECDQRTLPSLARRQLLKVSAIANACAAGWLTMEVAATTGRAAFTGAKRRLEVHAR